tara:strand:+ start:191 stop:1816 length:1626 start_codon:yes stop_codon:yes gene_type:complete
MSRARDLSRLSNPAVFSVDSSNNVGVNSTTPTAKLNVSGIVSATEFYGDGSNLEGVSSAGLGTALGETAPFDVIYYTNEILNINDTTTITVPTGSDTAYTQYADVVVADTKDLIIADGDNFVPDILGIATEGLSPLGSSGGRVRADFFTNHAGSGAPTFQTGLSVTGDVDIADKIVHTGDTNTSIRFPAADTVTVETAGSERFRVTSAGLVGIGTNNPDKLLHVQVSDASASSNAFDVAVLERNDDCYLKILSASNKVGGINFGDAAGSYMGAIYYDHTPNALIFNVNEAERARIDSTGNILIGGTPASTPNIRLNTAGTASFNSESQHGDVNIDANGEIQIGQTFDTSSNTARGVYISSGAVGAFGGVRVQSTSTATSVGQFFAAYRGNALAFNVSTGGNISCIGSLSKGSGSFKIDHPLKSETHHLVHSFVESPQADNIYRGKVDLVDGTAAVNIDTVAGMTDGTFVALNREIQCFTTNETGWTAIKGSVSGNVLTITAQENTCTDTISWLVIGERKDQHMYDTEWTDENGKVIVEPAK